MRILERLTLLSPGDLIPYAEALTSSMALLLEPAVPRRILQTVNKLWISLNTVMPRRYLLAQADSSHLLQCIYFHVFF